MSEEMKMSDVFDLLPVNTYITSVAVSFGGGAIDFLAVEDSGEHDCCSKRHAEYITHAINVHDQHTETIAQQAERIRELELLVKTSFLEGYGDGYGDGLSDGQSYSAKDVKDSIQAWQHSEAKQLLAKEGE